MNIHWNPTTRKGLYGSAPNLGIHAYRGWGVPKHLAKGGKEYVSGYSSAPAKYKRNRPTAALVV